MRRIKCYRVEYTPVEYLSSAYRQVDNRGCEFECETPYADLDVGTGTDATFPVNLSVGLLNSSGQPAFQATACDDTFATDIDLKWFPDQFSELKFTSGATFPFTGIDYELYTFRYGAWIGYTVSDSTVSPNCALYIELDVWGYDSLPSHFPIQLNARSCYILNGTQYSLVTGASQTLFNEFPIDITYTGHPSDLYSLHIEGV